MIVKINSNDFHNDWIEYLDEDSFEFVIAFTAGVNSFVYIDDGFESKIKINYTTISFPEGLPGNAIMQMGNARANRLGLPLRKQRGKNSVEENEN